MVHRTLRGISWNVDIYYSFGFKNLLILVFKTLIFNLKKTCYFQFFRRFLLLTVEGALYLGSKRLSQARKSTSFSSPQVFFEIFRVKSLQKQKIGFLLNFYFGWPTLYYPGFVNLQNKDTKNMPPFTLVLESSGFCPFSLKPLGLNF